MLFNNETGSLFNLFNYQTFRLLMSCTLRRQDGAENRST